MVYLRIVAGQHHSEVFYRIVPHLDIVCNSAFKEGYVLIDHRNRVDECHTVDGLTGLAVEQHFTLPWLIQPRHEAQDGALAATRGAYQSDALASLDFQREVTDDGRQVTVVAEGDVAQFYLTCQFGHIWQFVIGRQTQFSAFRLTVGHLLDALDRRVDPQSGLYAGNSPDDGIDGLVDKSL